mgnify:CR=1 FL=1
MVLQHSTLRETLEQCVVRRTNGSVSDTQRCAHFRTGANKTQPKTIENLLRIDWLHFQWQPQRRLQQSQRSQRQPQPRPTTIYEHCDDNNDNSDSDNDYANDHAKL